MFPRLALLSFVLIGPIALSASAEPKPDPFVTFINDHFPKWCKDASGKLSREEIDALVANPRIKGDEAAAVAAMHIYFRNNPKAPPLSQAFLIEAAGKQLPEERRDVVNKVQHFKADYNNFRNHIQNAPHEVFVGTAPQIEGVHQGSLGDCYLVSAIGAALHVDRNRVKQMFHPIKDGVYEIDFLDGSKAKVRLTDAQIALGSSAGPQGLWLNILEEAYGQVRFVHEPKKAPGDIPIDLISRGGDPQAAIALLTGHKCEFFEVLKHANDHVANNKLREAMIAGTKTHRLMCCGTGGKDQLPPGVIDGHCYAVIGFDPATDKVHVWNPWGNTFEPKKGPANLENGYAVKEGYFDVPFKDYVKIFGYFEIETHENVKPGKK